jgi:large subunit ribosomal protein L23
MILGRKTKQKTENAEAQIPKGANISREQMLRILQKPLISEKSTQGSQYNQITFLVPRSATKPQIKVAVENLFKVKVKAVNTSITEGKKKRFKGFLGQRSSKKKAIVTLMQGQAIDITTGI